MDKSLWHTHFVSLSDWLAGLAALLIAAALVSYWAMPTGTSCTTAPMGTQTCQTVSLAASAGWTSMVFTPLVVAVALGLGALFFHLRRSRTLLSAFGLATIIVFVLSFGADGPVIPAAIFSLAAAIVMRPKAGPSTR